MTHGATLTFRIALLSLVLDAGGCSGGIANASDGDGGLPGPDAQSGDVPAEPSPDGSAFGDATAPADGTAPGSADCPAENIDHCALSATASGGTSGACSVGYTGACTYTCHDGSWTAASNTCAGDTWPCGTVPMAEAPPLAVPHGSGQTYYVSPSGNDGNSGTLEGSPFATVQRAANQTQPGDTVLVMNGTYSPFSVARSGTASAYIVYQAYPGHSPVIQLSTNDWNGIKTDGGVAYVVIDGFEVVGVQQAITLAEAQAAWNCGVGKVNQTCIGGGDCAGGQFAHHIIVRNSKAHDCTSAGIGWCFADYITVENNIVHDNSWYSHYDGSGITLWELTDIDGNTGTKNVIRGNVVFNNKNLVSGDCARPGSGITDGNGIIIDDNLKGQSTNVPYNGRTLIENNVVFNNGALGIWVCWSQHVDVVNNTVYQNSTVLTSRGEVGWWGGDNRFYNNILVPADGRPQVAVGPQAAEWDYNLRYGGSASAVTGPNDLSIDPLFADAGCLDLRLAPASPAIGSGTADHASAIDILGTTRPPAAIDRGAYQSP